MTKKQTTSRPAYLWPETWKDMSEAAQRKEKQKWAIEKPQLENARRSRGIYLIDPADAEVKETIEKSWKFRCQQQFLVRSGKERTGRPVAILILAGQNTHAR